MRAVGRIPHLVIFYLLFGVLLIFLDSRAVLTPLHSLVQAATVPTQSKLYQTRQNLVAPLSWFSSRGRAAGELEKLRQDNSSLLARLEQLKNIEEENKNLRRLLGANVAPSWKFSPARVVWHEGDKFVLASDYVPEVGMAAVGAPADGDPLRAGILVGRVVQVIGKRIEVASPTSTTSKIPVVVSGQTQSASGLLVGRGGRAILDQVLTKETLGQDYAVLTSGGDSLPAGLLLGRIKKVLPIYEGAWQQAEVGMAAKVENLDYVFFVTKF